MRFGYFPSCEEWGPHELIAQAVRAHQASFQGLWISDTRIEHQRQSPFVWGVIGALAHATLSMRRSCLRPSASSRHRRWLPKMIAQTVTCGPGVDGHGEQIDAYAQAGFDELSVSQVRPDHDAFSDANREKVLPCLR